MRWSTHYTVGLATIALIITLVLCTQSINKTVRSYAHSEPADLRDVEISLDEIAKNTKAIDERLMSPGEYLQRKAAEPFPMSR